MGRVVDALAVLLENLEGGVVDLGNGLRSADLKGMGADIGRDRLARTSPLFDEAEIVAG
jgi:hypothetical protein